MKRRNFLQASAVAATATVTTAGQAMASSTSANVDKEIYELRVYHFKNGGGKSAVDKLYTEALIPFMNRNGVKVGAFGEYSLTEPPTVYFLLVYPSISEYYRIKNDIWNDKTFAEASKAYFDKSAEQGVYTRFETWLLEAFDAIPRFRQPDKSRGLIEMRLYESNNEEAGQRKIKMFNNEEIALFDQCGLHSLMFGEILAGPQMPALAYMLWFDDMKQREANWKKFVDSNEWNTMKDKPEYANTVSRVNRIFLVPLDYSQI